MPRFILIRDTSRKMTARAHTPDHAIMMKMMDSSEARLDQLIRTMSQAMPAHMRWMIMHSQEMPDTGATRNRRKQDSADAS